MENQQNQQPTNPAPSSSGDSGFSLISLLKSAGKIIARVFKKGNELINSVLPEHMRGFEKSQTFAAGATGLATICVLSGYGTAPLANLAGYLYPLYKSYKALTTPETDDDRYWLVYWVVFSTFSAFESVFAPILHRLPFYHLCKLGFLLWCYLPQTQGAGLVYQQVLQPAMQKYEQPVIEQVKRVIAEISADDDQVNPTTAAPAPAPAAAVTVPVPPPAAAAAAPAAPAASAQPINPPN